MSEPEMRGYAAAQREYENREPPDGEHRCCVCKGELPDDDTQIVSVRGRLACASCVVDDLDRDDDPCFDRDLDLED